MVGGQGRALGRRAVRPALLVVAVLGGVLLASSAPAAAEDYVNSTAHYRFSGPAGWTVNNTSEGDVVFLGPPDGGFAPNVIADHDADSAAQNSSTWLRNLVQVLFDELNTSQNITVVQGPRTFTTASGRLAADFLYNFTFLGIVVEQRQVYFVSEYHKTVYSFLFSDKSATFNAHGSDWATVVDSFQVDGERRVGPAPQDSPAPQTTEDPLYYVAGAIAIAAAGMVAVAAYRMRRQGAPPASPTSPPGGVRREPPRASPAPVDLEAMAAGRAPRPAPPPQGGGVPGQAGARGTPRAEGRAPGANAPAPSAGGPSQRSPATTAGGALGFPPGPAARSAPTGTRTPPPGREGAPPARPAAPKAPAPGGPAKIRCPKCATLFPGPASRPATVVCPRCGTKGVMK